MTRWGRLEAGPFARQLVAGGKHGESWQHYDPFILDMYKRMGGPSLHLRQIARMHETVKLEVKDGNIKNYQIIAPTTWNVGPRDARGIRGPIEEALMGAPIADPTDPVEVGHVARSFDSSLVCAVHAHDARSGKELARFRIG